MGASMGGGAALMVAMRATVASTRDVQSAADNAFVASSPNALDARLQIRSA